MKTRVLTAVVGIPLLLIVASLGGWWFFTVGLLAAVIALYEFHGFAAGLGSNLSLSALILGGVASYLCVYFKLYNLLVVLFVALLILELFRTRSVLKNGSLSSLWAASMQEACLPSCRY